MQQDCERCGRALGEDGRCPSCPPEPKSDVDRGRRQVMASGVSVIGALLLLASRGGLPLGGLLLYVVVFGLLLLQVFRGRSWARWLFVLLTGLGALLYAGAAAGVAGVAMSRALAIGFALVFALSALTLAFSRHVKAFVRAQRLRQP